MFIVKTFMRKHQVWSIEKISLQEAINSSSSHKEICEKLNYPHNKSSMKMIYYRAKKEDISFQLFRDNAKKTQRVFKLEYNLSNVLVKDSTYLSSVNLKKKLYKAGVFKNECGECGISEWNGKKLVCHLDHINGISNDNRVENLRILCPNCHSQTDTYAGKKRKGPKVKKLIDYDYCIHCKSESNGSLFCKKCQSKMSILRRKVERPSKDILLKEVEALGYLGTGRKYGVSDNAIRKWLKNY